ncbi:hypothetical protein ANCCAN_10944 [Ancylostoma caninum]|uniref:Uncharacterized protein n=1 Tax=Ancylostoma caninum TaxID=29170 RepID=A0A368GF99_ANCCA|nr:hypothetical protein ANCCAN_10944 [Ancylostoma caninum]
MSGDLGYCAEAMFLRRRSLWRQLPKRKPRDEIRIGV